METDFKLEIISPEKIVFSDKTSMVTVPSYEGDMSILKNHISIITFLRPGIIKVKKNDGNLEEFFVEEGTIEYFNDSLVTLSTSTINLKDLSKDNLFEALINCNFIQFFCAFLNTWKIRVFFLYVF